MKINPLTTFVLAAWALVQGLSTPAWAACPEASTFGNDGEGDSFYAGGTSYLGASKYVLFEAAEISALKANVSTPAGGSIRLGLYTHDSGNNKPGNLLVQAGPIAAQIGWNRSAVTPLTLPAGTYWLALIASNASLEGSLNDPAGSGTEGEYSATFSYGSLPAAFPTGVRDDWHWSLNAEYCPLDTYFGNRSVSHGTWSLDLSTASWRLSTRFRQVGGRTAVGVRLPVANFNNPPSYWVSLQGDNAGLPNNVQLAGATFTATVTGWQALALPAAPLINGQNYHIVIQYLSGIINATRRVGFVTGYEPFTPLLPLGQAPLNNARGLFYNGVQWYEDALSPVFLLDYSDGNWGNPFNNDGAEYPVDGNNTPGNATDDRWAAQNFQPAADWAVSHVAALVQAAAPGGDLLFELYNLTDAQVVAGGVFLVNGSAPLNPTWVEASLGGTFVLSSAKRYRLVFKSPLGGTANRWFVHAGSSTQSGIPYNGLTYAGVTDFGELSANGGGIWTPFPQEDLGFLFRQAPPLGTPTPSPTLGPSFTATPTFTAGVCGDSFAVGYPGAGALQNAPLGYLDSSGYVMSEDGVLSSLNAYVVASDGGSIRMAIYDDNGAGGMPGTLMGESAPQPAAVGWNVFALQGGPLSLPAGKYWIGFQVSTSGVQVGYSTGVSGDEQYRAQAYGAFPGSFGTSTAGSWRWAVFAAYCPSHAYAGNRAVADSFYTLTLDTAGLKASLRFKQTGNKTLSQARFSASDANLAPTYRVGIQADAGGQPSGSFLVSNNILPLPGWNAVPLNVALVDGQTYHLVIEYLSGTINATRNLVLRLGSDPQHRLRPMNQTHDRAMQWLYNAGAGWRDSGRAPTALLAYTDASHAGNSYDGAILYNVSGNGTGATNDDNVAAQIFQPATDSTVTHLGAYVHATVAAPGNDLFYAVYDITQGLTLTSGTLVPNGSAPLLSTWVEQSVGAGVTLLSTRLYRIIFNSPSITAANNYLVDAVKTEPGTPYEGLTFMGGASLGEWSTTGGLSYTSYPYEDLGFRLRLDPAAQPTSTPTATPSATVTPNCGHAGNGVVTIGTYDTNAAYSATRQTLAQASYITELRGFVNAGSGNLRLALYADNAGYPGALLAQSADLPVAGAGVIIADISDILVGSGSYWIAAISQGLTMGYSGGASPNVYASPQTYGLFPAQFPAGGTPATGDFAIGFQWCESGLIPTATATSTVSPTQTPTPTATETATTTATETATPSVTPSATPSATGTATASASPTSSATPSATPSATGTATPSATGTATASASPTSSATPSATPSATGTATPSATESATPSASPTASATASATPSTSSSVTPSATESATPSATPSPTETATPSATETATLSASPTSSATPSVTFSATETATPSATETATSSASPTSSATPSATPSATKTATPSATETATPSFTESPIATGTSTETAGPSATTTATPSASASVSPTSSATPSATPSSTTTATPSATETATPSTSPTSSATSTASPTLTATPSVSPSATPTASPTLTETPSVTFSATPSASPSLTATQTFSPLPTATASPSLTATPSGTSSATPTSSSTPSATASITPSMTVTASPSLTATQTVSPQPSATASPSLTATQTVSPQPSATASPTLTPLLSATFTPSITQTFTESPVPPPTFTPLPTGTPEAPAVLSHNIWRPALGRPLEIGIKSSQGGRVTVHVFNMAGERVRRPFQAEVPKDVTVNAVWDGRNESGDACSAGLYIVSVQGAGINRTMKVVLLK